MSEKIFTIAINESFSRYDGCPLCHLKDKLEESTLGYVLGAAMMDPDIRIKMNEQGFCAAHFDRLFSMKNKLELGLILESHLDHLAELMKTPVSGARKSVFSRNTEKKDLADEISCISASCFVCGKIEYTQRRYASNVAYLWQHESDFRKKLVGQPFICISHAAVILNAGKHELKTEDYLSLCNAVSTLISGYLASLSLDVTKFCVSFDHRNASKPLGDEKYAIDKAIKMLR